LRRLNGTNQLRKVIRGVRFQDRIEVIELMINNQMINDQVLHPILAKAARLQVLGKHPARFYLRLNRRIWRYLPSRVRNLYPVHRYEAWLHTLVCLCSSRRQNFGTLFLRNRPALELMLRLAQRKGHRSTWRIAVLGCSIGAEVYSILWTIRSARPDLKVVVCAVDVLEEALNFAEKGIYAPSTYHWVPQPSPASFSGGTATPGAGPIFERMTTQEKGEMFDWEGDQAKVKSWLREGIAWRLGDAADPELVRDLGPQDMVVASNFLCHMAPADAEKCLRNIGQLVSPGGHLFVSGVDLGVRTKVALDLGWEPVAELIAEIHDGDPSLRADWPWEWWSLEPLNRRRHNWRTRYAVAFRIASP
jgi:chemotaxis methyl-accepting protein methylase